MPELVIDLQPKQLEAFETIENGLAKVCFYGGAKGGGKSYFVRAKEVYRRLKYPGTTGAIFRRTYPELLANHIRKFWVEHPFAKDYYRSQEKCIYWPNGSVTVFSHLARTDDVYNYQGVEFDDISLDEATQHEEEVFKILKTSLRNDPKVIAKNPGFKPSFLLTGNPGGIGHGWVKRMFVDRKFNPNENQADYVFISAKIYDNPIFLSVNPGYLQDLKDLPTDLRRAYLEGDWNIFVGQFFSDWRDDIHVIDPIAVNDEWPKIFAIDWGYSPHPFHIGWYTKDFEGNIYKYREKDGTETPPTDLGKIVGELSKEDRGIAFGVGDTAMWAQNPFQNKESVYTDKSIADQINSVLQQYNLHMFQANKDRITGWTELRSLLKWDGIIGVTGQREFTRRPKLYIFKTCENTIACYPNMIHSELKPEDMEKIDGDDPVDTDRYAVMAIKEGIKQEEKKESHRDKLIKLAQQGRYNKSEYSE